MGGRGRRGAGGAAGGHSDAGRGPQRLPHAGHPAQPAHALRAAGAARAPGRRGPGDVSGADAARRRPAAGDVSRRLPADRLGLRGVSLPASRFVFSLVLVLLVLAALSGRPAPPRRLARPLPLPGAPGARPRLAERPRGRGRGRGERGRRRGVVLLRLLLLPARTNQRGPRGPAVHAGGHERGAADGGQRVDGGGAGLGQAPRHRQPPPPPAGGAQVHHGRLAGRAVDAGRRPGHAARLRGRRPALRARSLSLRDARGRLAGSLARPARGARGHRGPALPHALLLHPHLPHRAGPELAHRRHHAEDGDADPGPHRPAPSAERGHGASEGHSRHGHYRAARGLVRGQLRALGRAALLPGRHRLHPGRPPRRYRRHPAARSAPDGGHGVRTPEPEPPRVLRSLRQPPDPALVPASPETTQRQVSDAELFLRHDSQAGGSERVVSCRVGHEEDVLPAEPQPQGRRTAGGGAQRRLPAQAQLLQCAGHQLRPP